MGEETESGGKEEKTSDSSSPTVQNETITWTTFNGSQIIPVPLKDNAAKDTKDTKVSKSHTHVAHKEEEAEKDSSTGAITWSTYNGSQIIPLKGDDKMAAGSNSKMREEKINVDTADKKDGSGIGNNITWTTFNGSQIIPVPLKGPD